jgi:polyferredoxin
VHGLEAGRIVGERPAGVEGFLPIAALMSFRYWLARGVITQIHPAGLVIFVLALALGLVAKKSFCSWVCPVGAISEGLARVSRAILRVKMRLPRALDVPLRGIKYLLLAFFAWVIVIRMSADEVGAFLSAPYSRVADIKMLYFFEHLSSTAAIVLAALALLSIVVPYFWCRYLCPYGGLLGLLSMLSPLKVTRHVPSCIACGLCARACPSHLPVDRLQRVRSDECFSCLSCVAACPVPRALRLETPSPWRRAVRPVAFAALVLTLFAGGMAAARLAGHWRTSITNEEYLSRIHEIDGPQYTHVEGTMGTRR